MEFRDKVQRFVTIGEIYMYESKMFYIVDKVDYKVMHKSAN